LSFGTFFHRFGILYGEKSGSPALLRSIELCKEKKSTGPIFSLFFRGKNESANLLFFFFLRLYLSRHECAK
jgi:hypothetical protein